MSFSHSAPYFPHCEWAGDRQEGGKTHSWDSWLLLDEGLCHTLCMYTSNKNGQRNKDRGVLASKVAFFQRLAGYQSARGSDCLSLHHLFLFLFPSLIILFLSQLNFFHHYSSCFVLHPTGIVVVEWAAVWVLS